MMEWILTTAALVKTMVKMSMRVTISVFAKAMQTMKIMLILVSVDVRFCHPQILLHIYFLLPIHYSTNHYWIVSCCIMPGIWWALGMVWPAMLTLLYPSPKLILIKQFIALKYFCGSREGGRGIPHICLFGFFILFTDSGKDFGFGLILLVPDILWPCSVQHC